MIPTLQTKQRNPKELSNNGKHEMVYAGNASASKKLYYYPTMGEISMCNKDGTASQMILSEAISIKGLNRFHYMLLEFTDYLGMSPNLKKMVQISLFSSIVSNSKENNMSSVPFINLCFARKNFARVSHHIVVKV